MPQDHWNRHAAQWQHVGAPLRPAPEDVGHLERMIAERPAPSAVMLGVTPEIALMDWPADTRLLAVDRCQDMIDGVWPYTDREDRIAVCGDWMDLPVAAGSCDLVIGDGCFTLLPYPDGYRRVIEAVHRALTADGLYLMRYFCRPTPAEPIEAVFADLAAGRIENFHVLKWRIGMALHGPIETGLPVGQIWSAFEAGVPDRDRLVHELGWARTAIDTIDAYRDVDTPYTFPTLEEVQAVCEPYFEAVDVFHPDYQLGDRCPTVTYRRRA